jgi:hypothetical protein
MTSRALRVVVAVWCVLVAGNMVNGDHLESTMVVGFACLCQSKVTSTRVTLPACQSSPHVIGPFEHGCSCMAEKFQGPYWIGPAEAGEMLRA